MVSIESATLVSNQTFSLFQIATMPESTQQESTDAFNNLLNLFNSPTRSTFIPIDFLEMALNYFVSIPDTIDSNSSSTHAPLFQIHCGYFFLSLFVQSFYNSSESCSNISSKASSLFWKRDNVQKVFLRLAYKLCSAKTLKNPKRKSKALKPLFLDWYAINFILYLLQNAQPPKVSFQSIDSVFLCISKAKFIPKNPVLYQSLQKLSDILERWLVYDIHHSSGGSSRQTNSFHTVIQNHIQSNVNNNVFKLHQNLIFEQLNQKCIKLLCSIFRVFSSFSSLYLKSTLSSLLKVVPFHLSICNYICKMVFYVDSSSSLIFQSCISRWIFLFIRTLTVQQDFSTSNCSQFSAFLHALVLLKEKNISNVDIVSCWPQIFDSPNFICSIIESFPQEQSPILQMEMYFNCLLLNKTGFQPYVEGQLSMYLLKQFENQDNLSVVDQILNIIDKPSNLNDIFHINTSLYCGWQKRIHDWLFPVPVSTQKKKSLKKRPKKTFTKKSTKPSAVSSVRKRPSRSTLSKTKKSTFEILFESKSTSQTPNVPILKKSHLKIKKQRLKKSTTPRKPIQSRRSLRKKTRRKPLLESLSARTKRSTPRSIKNPSRKRVRFK